MKNRRILSAIIGIAQGVIGVIFGVLALSKFKQYLMCPLNFCRSIC